MMLAKTNYYVKLAHGVKVLAIAQASYGKHF